VVHDVAPVAPDGLEIEQHVAVLALGARERVRLGSEPGDLVRRRRRRAGGQAHQDRENQVLAHVDRSSKALRYTSVFGSRMSGRSFRPDPRISSFGEYITALECRGVNIHSSSYPPGSSFP